MHQRLHELHVRRLFFDRPAHAGAPAPQAIKEEQKSRAEMGHVKAVQELLELGFEKVKSKPP